MRTCRYVSPQNHGLYEVGLAGTFSLTRVVRILQMVTVEVELKEGDEPPEQHLDEGEHIERVIVPLNELYDKLQGECSVSVLDVRP